MKSQVLRDLLFNRLVHTFSDIAQRIILIEYSFEPMVFPYYTIIYLTIILGSS